MKIAVLNDTHHDIRNASDIFLNSAEKFYSEVFFPYLIKNDIKRIIHLGDAFDNRKTMNIKALNHYRHVFLSKLREYGIRMDIIPGNHDVYYKNTNSMNALKEFLGHYMDEIDIHMDPTVLRLGGIKIGLVPWITRDNEEECKEFIQNADVDVLGGHFELNGFDLMRGRKMDHGMDASPFARFPLVMSGHYHTKSHQGNIHYLGSQMEFTWSDAHDPKFFHVLDTQTKKLEAIRNPNTLFQKLVYNDQEKVYNQETIMNSVPDLTGKFVKIVILNKYYPEAFDSFLDHVNSYNYFDLKVTERFDDYNGSSVDDEDVNVESTKEALDSYVDAVVTDLDRSRLKYNMVNLYEEAQAQEVL